MRLLLFIAGVFVAVLCIEKSAEAQNYPWCGEYGGTPSGPTPIAGPAHPRNRRKRAPDRRGRARHSKRLIPRQSRAAGSKCK